MLFAMTPTDRFIHVPVCSSAVPVPVATTQPELPTVHSQSSSYGSQVQERRISDHKKNTHTHYQHQAGAESSPLSPDLPTTQHFDPSPSSSSFSSSYALLPKATEQLSSLPISSQLENIGSERYHQEPESVCTSSSTPSRDFSNPASLSSIVAIETEQLWDLVMSTKMPATFKVMLDDEQYHHSVLNPRCFEWHSAAEGIRACKTCLTIYDTIMNQKPQVLSLGHKACGHTERQPTESNSLESNILETRPADSKARQSETIKSNPPRPTRIVFSIQNSVADVHYERLASSLNKYKDDLHVVCQILGDMLFVEFRRIWELDSCEYRVKRQNMVENLVLAKLPPVLRQATPPRSQTNSAIQPCPPSSSGLLSKRPIRLEASLQAQSSICTGYTNITTPGLMIPENFYCDLAYCVDTRAVDDLVARFALTLLDPCCTSNLTSPYFAVVFDERDPSDTKTEKNSLLYTKNKFMSIGLVYLYNRYLLRHDSLMKEESSDLPQEFEKDILFFGITVSRGLQFSVFAIEPKLSDLKWQGCIMHELALGMLSNGDDVKLLIGFVGGIQAWAVVHYIEGLKKDAHRLAGHN